MGGAVVGAGGRREDDADTTTGCAMAAVAAQATCWLFHTL
jgi:hypothetical protein